MLLQVLLRTNGDLIKLCFLKFLLFIALYVFSSFNYSITFIDCDACFLSHYIMKNLLLRYLNTFLIIVFLVVPNNLGFAEQKPWCLFFGLRSAFVKIKTRLCSAFSVLFGAKHSNMALSGAFVPKWSQIFLPGKAKTNSTENFFVTSSK